MFRQFWNKELTRYREDQKRVKQELAEKAYETKNKYKDGRKGSELGFWFSVVLWFIEYH